MKPWKLLDNDDYTWDGEREVIFKTPVSLFDLGICLCDFCGKKHSIDFAYCDDCNTRIFIDVDRSEVKNK